MSDMTKFKINLKTGDVEFEGSEEFVEKQIQNLEEIIGVFSQQPDSYTNNSAEYNQPSPSDNENKNNGNSEIPDTFGEWLHSFKSDINDLEKALITARFVQSQSSENDFKTSEVNKSLKDHGIKLSNPSTSLKRLVDKKYLFQTRKKGSLIFMRLSVDGQNHLESIKS